MTASACGVPVQAGPIEATVLGNIAVQLIASGALRDVAEAREVVARSETLREYLPEDASAWQEAFGRYTEIVH